MDLKIGPFVFEFPGIPDEVVASPLQTHPIALRGVSHDTFVFVSRPEGERLQVGLRVPGSFLFRIPIRDASNDNQRDDILFQRLTSSDVASVQEGIDLLQLIVESATPSREEPEKIAERVATLHSLLDLYHRLEQFSELSPRVKNLLSEIDLSLHQQDWRLWVDQVFDGHSPVSYETQAIFLKAVVAITTSFHDPADYENARRGFENIPFEEIIPRHGTFDPRTLTLLANAFRLLHQLRQPIIMEGVGGLGPNRSFWSSPEHLAQVEAYQTAYNNMVAGFRDHSGAGFFDRGLDREHVLDSLVVWSAAYNSDGQMDSVVESLLSDSDQLQRFVDELERDPGAVLFFEDMATRLPVLQDVLRRVSLDLVESHAGPYQSAQLIRVLMERGVLPRVEAYARWIEMSVRTSSPYFLRPVIDAVVSGHYIDRRQLRIIAQSFPNILGSALGALVPSLEDLGSDRLSLLQELMLSQRVAYNFREVFRAPWGNARGEGWERNTIATTQDYFVSVGDESPRAAFESQLVQRVVNQIFHRFAEAGRRSYGGESPELYFSREFVAYYARQGGPPLFLRVMHSPPPPDPFRANDAMMTDMIALELLQCAESEETAIAEPARSLLGQLSPHAIWAIQGRLGYLNIHFTERLSRVRSAVNSTPVTPVREAPLTGPYRARVLSVEPEREAERVRMPWELFERRDGFDFLRGAEFMRGGGGRGH